MKIDAAHRNRPHPKARGGRMGLFAERVSEPSEVIPAFERALAANEAGQPAYIELICSQYPVYGQWVRSSRAH